MIFIPALFCSLQAFAETTIKTKDWYAWINKMPLSPPTLNITAEVLAANSGMTTELTVRKHQGFNPAILMLDLNLHEKQGNHPQILTWKQVRFAKPAHTKYLQVEIFYKGESVKVVEVEEVY